MKSDPGTMYFREESPNGASLIPDIAHIGWGINMLDRVVRGFTSVVNRVVGGENDEVAG
jgi:hypothetical protein